MSNKPITKCERDSCLNGLLITDLETGEILCSSCGRVLIDKIEDLEFEHHTFSKEEYLKRSRTGTKISLAKYDQGLPTVIGTVNRDASGKFLSGDIKSRFHRLRILDLRSKSKSSNAYLIRSFLVLDAVKAKLAIPEAVVEKAAYMFRKTLTKKLWAGRDHAMMLASLYAACRETNTPRTLQEIAIAGNVKKRVLVRYYRILTDILDLKLRLYDPSEFVTRICNNLGLRERTCRLAMDILLRHNGKIFYGRHPMSLAAAAVYIACMINAEKKSQTEIANVSGISSVTLRGVYMLLKPLIDKSCYDVL